MNKSLPRQRRNKTWSRLFLPLGLVLMLVLSFSHNFSAPTAMVNADCANCDKETTGLAAAGEAQTPVLSAAEFAGMRREIYEKEYTFTIGYNPATNYPLSQLCGFNPQFSLQSGLATAPEIKALKALPSRFDWREQGGVTPVKNQGNCGSCWAFAATGVLECNIKIKDKTTVDLSEQYLVSCNSDGWGCNGGWWPHKYHVSPGAVLESCFPYQARDVACKSSCAHPYKIDSWGYVGSANGVPSVDAIKTAIYQYGPVAVAVAADSYFQSYTGGVFNRNSSSQVNHAVVLVGWDDSQQCWILRNSWGSGWGESGYMRIKYGVNQVGYGATYVVYKGGSTPTPDPEPEPDPTPSGNLCLNKPVSASGYYSSAYHPRYAVDGNQSTRWVTYSYGTPYITVDLQQNRTIKSMRIKWSATNYPRTYYVYRYSNNQWVRAATINSNGDWDSVTFSSPFTSRYVRISCTNPTSSTYVMYEYELYGQ
ncbi:MAG TPA: hypothetical protein GX391_09830 [Firmicutes bacterium]|nr:hypothetical protein [Bacillota bacterium]HOQ24786.1 C1 family peptidase [Bacillota bacterium]HPT68018.1 C1 family peptidase [Bacillota bacterium]